MILTCPICETKFKVDDSLIPAEGRMVRCSNCKNEWHANHEAPGTPEQKPVAKEIKEIKLETKKTTIQAFKEEPEEGSNLFVVWPVLLLICWSFFFFAFNKPFILEMFPSLSNLYSTINNYEIRGFKFDDISIGPVKTNQGNFIVVTGKINNSNKVTIPNLWLKISLKDKDMNLLQEAILPYISLDKISEGIKPDQKIININYPMQVAFNPDIVRYVELDIANEFEFQYSLR